MPEFERNAACFLYYINNSIMPWVDPAMGDLFLYVQWDVVIMAWVHYVMCEMLFVCDKVDECTGYIQCQHVHLIGQSVLLGEIDGVLKGVRAANKKLIS